MPPLFDKLAKGVSKAAEQAKFEAEKVRRTSALNSEIAKLKAQVLEAKVAIADKVLDLRAAGGPSPNWSRSSRPSPTWRLRWPPRSRNWQR